MPCNYGWIGIAAWWCQLDSNVLAAWVQAIGSVGAIVAAVGIYYRQKVNEENERLANNRKVVMSAAANLESALSYQSVVLDFAPAGDGVIGHPITDLKDAVSFLQLQPRTKEAIREAVEKAHYFSMELCEQMAKLSVQAAAYDRLIEQNARIGNNRTPDEFFKGVTATRLALSAVLDETRKMLQAYLPNKSF
jgi:hypothetical protein